ncbi:nucleoside deaminase [Nocardioides panacisoli]|uniref:nucleoside deaminase n=1 Tax=Nocardioides panacisoli TaxID=627624 RepID=UPI001F3625B2|nr:nucleoside deaminase [Nocardioides panacisoli]
MTITEDDLRHLDRCVELAERAVEAGDEPFGSVLVAPDGSVLLEDHNHVSGGNGTRHPELAIALWAGDHLAPEERAAHTVYTSGEHCPMCAAAHAWVGLGRIVYATSTPQLLDWLADLGLPSAPVRHCASPTSPRACRSTVPWRRTPIASQRCTLDTIATERGRSTGPDSENPLIRANQGVLVSGSGGRI